MEGDALRRLAIADIIDNVDAVSIAGANIMAPANKRQPIRSLLRKLKKQAYPEVR